MITLISKNNFNVLINEKTGKWFSFDYVTNNCVIKNITNKKLKELFCNYDEFKEYLSELKNSNEPVNTKLIDMNYLILHVSDVCNMNCKYCYATDNLIDNNSNKMTSDTMIKSILKFYKGNDFYVLFHGREPLTNYDNILKTLEYFKDKKNIHFILQTNGLLLDDNKMKQLRKYGVIINVSIDGINDNNNVLRINNTKIDYTRIILDKIVKYKINPIIIVHKNNYKDLVKITNFLTKNGITSASYNFLWPTSESTELSSYVVPQELLIKEMKNVFNNSIKDNKFIFKERDLYLLYGRILKRDIYNYMCNTSPCGAGKNCLSIYKEGQIYPCTMVNCQKENYLGEITDNTRDILNKKVILKTRDIKKIKECSTCPIRIFCRGGGCSGFIYNLTKDINAKSLYCDYYYEMIIYIMQSIYKMSNKKFFINN